MAILDQPTTRLPELPATTGRPAWLWPALMASLLVVLLAGVTATAAGYVLYYNDRVLPGVYVADVDLGGLRPNEAQAALTRRLKDYTSRPLVLAAGSREWQIAPGDLGVGYDIATSVEEAFQIGRVGPSADRLAVWWPLSHRSTHLQPVGRLDQGAMLAGLKPVLQSLNRPPVDASLELHPTSGVTILSANRGEALDLTSATLTLQRRAATLSTEPIPLTVQPLPPLITDDALNGVKEAADGLLAQPFSLEAPVTGETRRWQLSPAELAGMIALTGESGRTLMLDEVRLAERLAAIAAEIHRPGRDADLRLTDALAPVITAHQDRLVLDVAASIAVTNRAIASGQHRAELVIRLERPAVVTADLEPVRAQLAGLLDRQLTIRFADRSQVLDRKEIASYLQLTAQTGATERIAITTDREALTLYLTSLAKTIKREPRAPVFRYLNGKVTTTLEAVQGRALDEPGALTELTGGLLSTETTSVTLPITIIEPAHTVADPSLIVIRDVLAEGVTYYGFSLPERKHNVELATQRLNGTLVPPGELFSFNRAVGRVNTASGYRTGYGIVLTNGAVQTVPSVGGGICQVATTVFHAAFRSGVTIGERNWHFYWIPTYGQAPSGLTGLDATVDEDYGLDFTFRNTTGGWIAIETSYDGQNMHVRLRGVRPGWEVRIGEPVISNVIPHDPTPVEREDSSLAPGRRLQIETARDGMDVAIARTVIKDGQIVDQRTFRSHYEPSQNVTLVGPTPADAPKDPPAGDG